MTHAIEDLQFEDDRWPAVAQTDIAAAAKERSRRMRMVLPLTKLLVRSPLQGVYVLMQQVVSCTALIPTLIEALLADDSEGIARLTREISQLEGRADRAKNEVRDHLPAKLFMPVDRRDLLTLVSQIDAVADCAEDVGVLLTLKKLTVPEDMKPLLRTFVQRVMDTVYAADDLVKGLAPLLEASFGGAAAATTRRNIERVQRMEHEADKVQDQIAKVLFEHEHDLSPVTVFMWTKVLNKIGDIANHAENVGDQFRLFLAR